MRRTLFPALAMTGVLVIGLASPAYADIGTLSFTTPVSVTTNVEFQTTINFANNTGAAIADPEVFMYISFVNGSGTLLPLPLAEVNVKMAWDGAPADAIGKWATSPNQVGVKIYPNVHADLPNGSNSNHILKVKIHMPSGAAKLQLAVRVFKSGSFSTVYATKFKEIAVITPPAPTPTPVAPSPRPRITPSPRPSRVVTSAAPSPSQAVPSPSEVVPSPTEAAATTAAPELSVSGAVTEATGIPIWVWLIGGLLILVGLVLLIWLIVRNRSTSDDETVEI